MRARQQGCALVDLVEGIGHEDPAAGSSAQCRLGEGEQRFTRAIHRQNFGCRVDFRAEALAAPVRHGFAQRVAAAGGWIRCQMRSQRRRIRQGLDHELGRRVFWFAQGKRDVRKIGICADACGEGGEFFKGVGLQGREKRVVSLHGSIAGRCADATRG